MCVFLFSSYFLLSVCCCLCVLEACDTKTNSLYAQAYLAIKLFLILRNGYCLFDMLWKYFCTAFDIWKYNFLKIGSNPNTLEHANQSLQDH